MNRWAMAAVAAGVVVCASATAQETEDHARGRILVMPRAGVSDTELARQLKPFGGSPRRVGQSRLFIVDLPAHVSEKAVVQQLAHHPQFKFAELDRRGQLAFVPTDPYFGSQWHTPFIGATSAWDATQGAGVTIAILDTGVDATHPDLAPRIVPGWNFENNNADTSDPNGHGTKSAGAAAAVGNNALGVAGVAFAARIMPLRITAPDGSFWYSALAQGITYAADHGARVANVSLYGAAGSASVLSAAEYMKGKGGLVVTSAGNNAKNEGWAATTSLIGVSATDAADALTSWSSYGSFVSLAAPGVGIYTTTAGGGYGAVSGTSFSSPVTAGVVALVMAANPRLTAGDVERVLFSTAFDLGAAGKDIYYGHGRVNAAAAVQAALVSAPAADTQAPSAAISQPTGGATVSGWVAVNVSATDDVGVAKVELQVNGTTVATDTTAPFAFSWDSTAVSGSASLVAVAHDAAGNAGASAAALVQVANAPKVVDSTPPSVSIGSPVDGSQVVGNVTVQVTATDDAGAAGLAQELYIDGKLVATASGGTLGYRWNVKKASRGSHSIVASARDAAGNRTTRTVTVFK